ncbi:MAG: CARDB domain-containing protein [bacterium]
MSKFIKWRIVGASAICLGFLAMAALPNVCGAQTATSTGEIATSTPVCFDSDGGKDYDHKGKISYANDVEMGTGEKIDFCGGTGDHSGDHSNVPKSRLYEYYCGDSGSVLREFKDCPNGCQDGACIKDIDIIITKVDNITSNSARVYWQASMGSIGEYKLAKSESELNNVISLSNDVINDPNITGNFNGSMVELKNLKPETKYYVELKKFYLDNVGNYVYGNPVVVSFSTIKNVLDLPDLVIDEITLSPANPVPNKEVKILVKGKNNGSAPIVFVKGKANPLYMRVVFPGFTQKSFLILPDIKKDYTIAPQGIFSYTFVGYFKTGGSKNLTAMIDGFAVLKESNEKNNTFKKKIETAFLCADSDGGQDFYKKGTTKGYDSYGGNISKVATYTDKCCEVQDKSINYTEEFYCETQNDPTGGAGYVVKTGNYCLIGCNDGACIKNANGLIDVDLNKTLLTQKELGKKFILIDLAISTPSVSSSEDSRIDIGIEAIGTSTQNTIESKQKIRQVYASVDYEKNEQSYGLDVALYNSLEDAQTEYKDNVGAMPNIALKKWEKFGDDVFCSKPKIFQETNVKKYYIRCGFKVKNVVAVMMLTNRLSDKYSVALASLKQYYNKLVKEMGKEQKISKVKGESVEKPYAKYLSNLAGDIQNLSSEAQERLKGFILDGANEDTKLLGEGERTAVVFSYKDAYGKLPETEEEFSDLEKIANGRWPSALSQNAEEMARQQFSRIFKREADADNANDNAAVVVMAYGLRQKSGNRNVSKERNALDIFKSIYGHHPWTTADWNIAQAIAYSGAVK